MARICVQKGPEESRMRGSKRHSDTSRVEMYSSEGHIRRKRIDMNQDFLSYMCSFERKSEYGRRSRKVACLDT